MVIYQSKVYNVFVFFFAFYSYFTVLFLIVNIHVNNHKKILFENFQFVFQCAKKLLLLFWEVKHTQPPTIISYLLIPCFI